MDVASQLQAFEQTLSNYTGDDLLNPWDRFIEYLQRTLPAEDSRGMSLVLDRLVQRFLLDERYANDVRYLNYCIKCASYYKDPIKLYSYIYSKGIGTRAAILYMAWAQQFEQQGQVQHADMVYQRALENQAEPVDTVIQQYRMFQTRTSRSGAGAPGARNPLQNSQVVNQLQSHSEPDPQCKDTGGLFQQPADRTVRIISRSENVVGKKPSQGPACLQTVSMYSTGDLICEGSELCFEEVRATRYFVRCKEEKKRREFAERLRLDREEDEEMMLMNKLLEELKTNIPETATGLRNMASTLPGQQAPCTPATSLNLEFLQQSFRHPPLSNNVCIKTNVGLKLKSAQEHRQGTEPETHLLGKHLKTPITDTLNSQKHVSPSGQSKENSCSRYLQRPHASMDDLHEYTEATVPVAGNPQSNSLQAFLFPPQPEQHARPFGSAAQDPSAYRSEVRQFGGLPCQGGGFLQQNSSRDCHEASDIEALESEVKLNVSQGGTGNLSHVTPNTSLGLVQATPSRILPSPTVNTREALDAIMDMFQAPTLLQEDQFPSMLMNQHQSETSFDAGYQRTGSTAFFGKPPSAVPFAIFQDENDDKENGSAATVSKDKPQRALAELPLSKIQKQNDSQSELAPDESTMWGTRYNPLNSVAACPNNTRDFALLAKLASTPFHNKAPYSWDCDQDQVTTGFDGPKEGPFLRQPTKLSPIIEQSPTDGMSEPGAQGLTRAQGFADQGTIVEGLVQHHASTALSFRDQTAPLAHTEGQVATSTALSFRDQTAPLAHTEGQVATSTALSFRDQTAPLFHTQGQVATSTALSFRDQTAPLFHTQGQVATSTALSFRDQTAPLFHTQGQVATSTALSFRDQTAPLFHTQGQVATSTALSFRDQTAPLFHTQGQVATSTALSFKDQTAPLFHTEGPVAKTPSSKPDWDIYVSPEKPLMQSLGPFSQDENVDGESLSKSQIRGFNVPASPEKAPMSAFDIPASPEFAPLADWLVVKSPEVRLEPDLDLDAFMSPRQRTDDFPQKTSDVPMSPEPPGFSLDVNMSPVPPLFRMDSHMNQSPLRQSYGKDIPMSPEQASKLNMDFPLSPPAQEAMVTQLVSNPWDEDLISSLLSKLSTPISSWPNFITWDCKVPNITPKMTITMGAGSLQVDCVVGQGAFATVFQASDKTTSEKMILKVQKPANPWEFYINAQLNARLQPNVRHLFNNIQSAHLFQNGSVLLGELYKCGTLLNAVNLYKNMSEKVMPQPLVIYFTVSILYMVEQLHNIHIIHADIKPDNFLLGERFMDNTPFHPDNLDHGLTLIDLGQSIDMTLFPEGTAFTAKCLTSGFQCTEMQSGRPWNYQTDYFGIAGTVYCMIFGSYMQVRQEGGVWKTNGVFRRNPLSDLWTEFFHTLLNVPDCKSLPCLRSLRSRLTDVLQQNYGNKLSSLKSRLIIQLMESRSARR
ncbi:hypothetical protein UPYG_G00250490 [Umbra pygmaea]|uniref:BUB1 n=1 Tax=Umbra pygmaea TaxID=75934 RepID=A0ABD0WSP5_UMBPY